MFISMQQEYDQWHATSTNPTGLATFTGGWVAGAWSMRERILALPQVAAHNRR